MVAFTLTSSREGQTASGSLHSRRCSQMVPAKLFCWECFLSKYQPQRHVGKTAKLTIQKERERRSKRTVRARLFLQSLAAEWLLLSSLSKHLEQTGPPPRRVPGFCRPLWVRSPLQCLCTSGEVVPRAECGVGAVGTAEGRPGREQRRNRSPPIYRPSHDQRLCSQRIRTRGWD